jgi:hypothetical protein
LLFAILRETRPTSVLLSIHMEVKRTPRSDLRLVVIIRSMPLHLG